MIQKGTLIVRLTSSPGPNKQTGQLFEAVKDHEDKAFYTPTKALAKGYYALANEDDIKAFAKGIRIVDITAYTGTALGELGNLLNAKLKVKEGFTADNVHSSVKKRKYNLWSEESMTILMAYARGGYSTESKFIKEEIFNHISTLIDRAPKDCMIKYRYLIRANRKQLKRAGFSPYSFWKIFPKTCDASPDSNKYYREDNKALQAKEKKIAKNRHILSPFVHNTKPAPVTAPVTTSVTAPVPVAVAGNRGGIIDRPLTKWTKSDKINFIKYLKAHRTPSKRLSYASKDLIAEAMGRTNSAIAQQAKFYKKNPKGFYTSAGLSEEEHDALEAVLLTPKATKKSDDNKTRLLNEWTVKDMLFITAIGKGNAFTDQTSIKGFEKAACFVDHSWKSCENTYSRIKSGYKEQITKEIFDSVKPIYIDSNLEVCEFPLDKDGNTLPVRIELKPAKEEVKPAKEDKAVVIEEVEDVEKIEELEELLDFGDDIIVEHVENEESAFMDHLRKSTRYTPSTGADKEKKPKRSKKRRKKEQLVFKAVLLLTKKLDSKQKLALINKMF